MVLEASEQATMQVVMVQGKKEGSDKCTLWRIGQSGATMEAYKCVGTDVNLGQCL